MQSIFAFMLPACFSLGVLTAAANTRGQYGFPDALQLLPRILALGALLALSPPRAASFLPWGYVIGSIAAVFLLPLFIPAPTRSRLDSDHLPLRPETKDASDRNRTQTRSRLWALVLSLLGLQITSWLQIRYATKVGSGTITYLELSQTVMAVLPSVILRAASSIAYAEAARDVADKGPDAPSRLLKSLVELGLFLMFPVIIFIAAFSEDISRLLFVRGHFSADDGHRVASLIVAFSAASIIAAVQHALNVCFLLEKDLPLGKFGAIQMVVAVVTHWTLLQLLYSPYGMFALPIAVAGSGGAVVALRFTLIKRWRQGAISMFADLRIWKILALAGIFSILAVFGEGLLARQPERSATFAFGYLVLAAATGGGIYLFGGYLLGIWTPSMLRGKAI
jgi:peptidoglycan biosynthesis protein MviN/MurJ (putative lipid II flippase)